MRSLGTFDSRAQIPSVDVLPVGVGFSARMHASWIRSVLRGSTLPLS